MTVPDPIRFFGQLIAQISPDKETELLVVLNGVLFLGLFILMPASAAYDLLTIGLSGVLLYSIAIPIIIQAINIFPIGVRLTEKST